MFIYHFNRMIRSRILWIIFAVVIAFAFLSVDSCVSGGSAREKEGDSVGTIGTSPISFEEYNAARGYVDFFHQMPVGIPPAVTETQILAHVAAFRTADDLGIVTSREEIRANVLADPAFQSNGSFDNNLYKQVLRASRNITPVVYERLLAQRLTIAKLMATIPASAVASPIEVDAAAAAQTDTFTFRYATVTNAFFTAEVTNTLEEVQAYFTENKKDYALPDRVSVCFFSVPVSNYYASVSISEDDIGDFYDSNISSYTMQTTNGFVQLPLESVRGSISNELVSIEAVDVARTEIGSFMDVLLNDSLEVFNQRAKGRGHKMSTTPLFSYEQTFIPGVEQDAVRDFCSAAFELDASRNDSLYNIACGKKFVYLMRVVTNDFAHTPSFDSLKASIEPLVTAQKRSKLFDDHANAIANAIRNSDKSFEEACGTLELNVSTSMVFTTTAPMPEEINFIRPIITEVISLNENEISDPVRIANGAAIALVEKRTPASEFDFEQVRAEVAETLNSSAQYAYFQNWLIWNLESQGFSSRNLDLYISEDYSDEE